ncbi:MAG: hypothetical protein J7539_09110 [Niabella sp.]|nr:hypothetical protein [Niabella sp.]
MKFVTICFLLALTIAVGCKKGDAGPKGDTGPMGNANIQYSAWDSTFSGTSATWNVPALTQAVLNNSVVMVYARQNGVYVYPLPYDNVNGSGFYVNMLLSLGQIKLFCNPSYNLNQFAFRYVIAPGNTPISSLQPNPPAITLYHTTP